MSAVIEMHGVVMDRALPACAARFFFLITISIAAFLLSLPGLLGRMPARREGSRRALMVSLAFGYVSPVTLFAGPRPHAASSIDWEAYLIPFYLLGLGLFTWLCLRPTLGRLAERGSPSRRIRQIYCALAYGGHDSRAATALAALLCGMGALAVLVYVGMEIMVLTGGQGLSYTGDALRHSTDGMTLNDVLAMVAMAGLSMALYLLLTNVIRCDD